MYRITDKRAAIREIQRYLYTIATLGLSDIPRVAVDGIYAQGTEDAVRRFQQLSDLEVNGRVDYKTFVALYALYDDAVIKRGMQSYIVSGEGFPFKEGDLSSDIEILHVQLRELGKYFELGIIPQGSYFGTKTADAVRRLQRIFRLEANGYVDEVLYNLILNELNARKSNPAV